jgi:blue copper oxidase
MRSFIVAFLFFSFELTAQNALFIPDTLVGSSINLSLQEGSVNFYPGLATQTMGVNGNLLGPTLILNKTETVTMNVTNNLMDSSTIHWHGMHVSSLNDGSPHIVISPGSTWSPVIPVMDWAGTYWYHPHLHSHTHEQVQKGIAGLIIVRDNTESALALPRSYGIDDIPLVIQTKAFDATNQIITLETALDTSLMINGTIDPFVGVPEQVVRFRVLNGSSERVYNIGLSNNQTFYQIASDGGLLTSPVSLTRLRLSPGERAELLINFSGLLGQSVQLVSYGAELPSAIYGATQPGMGAGQVIPNYASNPLNGANFQLIDFNIIAATVNAITAIPTTLVTHAPWLAANSNITRTLTFSPQNMGPTAINGPFMFDMTMFDMMMINQYVPYNNTEIWTLTNNTPIAHPFHIHDVQFYILDINGIAPPLNQQGRKDVILVPAGGGIVRFITKFEDFYNDTVPYMYHCHMLTHEDGGMMGQFIVQAPPVGINEINFTNSGNLFPNPVINNLTISELDANQTIKLVDLSGKDVFSQFTEQTAAILNLSSLVSGVYFVVYTHEKNTEIRKIIKN